jgi:hypothetical protein
MVLKYGTEVQLSEASTLRFLAKNTSIPVPKVYCSFERGNTKYIMMEYVKGQAIGGEWAEMLPEEKESLLKQLKKHFDELRNIPHPRLGTICGADMGSLFDRRIHLEGLGFGPFANGSDFNDFLRCGISQGDELGALAESYFKTRVFKTQDQRIGQHSGSETP